LHREADLRYSMADMNSPANRAPTDEPRPAKIMVVDDEKLIRWSLRARLEADGHVVVEAATGAEALAALEDEVDLILLDYRLPDIDGFEVLRRARRRPAAPPVIMLTAYSNVDHAVEAMKAGAYHYAGKPFDIDELALTVRSALQAARLRQAMARSDQPAPTDRVDGIIGEAPVMRRIKALIGRIAASPASTVLVTGESGTGKDLVARAIHAQSERRDGPFLNITCSALPSALLESELFGHERGAFTDAKARKPGLFEHADGGTVFLDEIGEMEAPLQAKLLRFLEDKRFRRVGGAQDLRADVRVVAATNVDLREAVRDGSFRGDLYYRLAVLAVQLPPLRERQEDLPAIAAHLIERFNQEFGREIRGIAPDALDLLIRHPWPGNVRELRNALERAVLLSEGDELHADDFSFLGATAIDDAEFRLPASGLDMRELEHDLVVQALERAGGNQTRAAELLGMNRDQIRYRINRFGLKERKSRSS
jgi:two-component system, NtrC family, response regulator AtoC